jgi:hypothetical protein
MKAVTTTMRYLWDLTQKVLHGMLQSEELLPDGIWEKPMAATSTTHSLFLQKAKAKSCIYLKVPLIYYPTAPLGCFPEGTGGKKTLFRLQAL